MGTECDNPYDTRFRPERLLVFDKHPGGIGLAQQARPQTRAWMSPGPGRHWGYRDLRHSARVVSGTTVLSRLH